MEFPETALLILLCPDSFLCLECAEGGCEYPDCDCTCHHRLDNARAEARAWLRWRAQHTEPGPADASKRIADLEAALRSILTVLETELFWGGSAELIDCQDKILELLEEREREEEFDEEAG